MPPMIATMIMLAVLAGEGSMDVAPTAGVGRPAGILEFTLLDDGHRPIPGRLTFVPDAGRREALFPNPGAAPDDLAVRDDVIYSLSGRGRVTVPPGAYTVYASRGLEWSIATARMTFAAGEVETWSPVLVHEVRTPGWISGDFHLHTLTYSGHGDSNMAERIISIIGEGIEFAVATDHNHNTDYGPTIDHLGAGAALTAITGNEVSTPIGHFNAFPLDPTRPPVDASLDDANTLFRLLRRETGPDGTPAVIQVNHPRWEGIDYFALGGLDPVTGASTALSYSLDFDSIEVLNENSGWGYHQPFVEDADTASNLHSVIRDWYNLLNRGHRYAAVGNSDSHAVRNVFAGYPRNFVASTTDDAAAIDAAAIADAIRSRRVFTTLGPFVECSVDGTGLGGLTTARDGVVEVSVRVQAASWIDCDRVRIVVNGDVVDEIDVPDTREPLRLEASRRVPVTMDSWVALIVEGDDPLDPIVTSKRRPIRPVAVVNPVWVDADGDGRWTSPRAWARTLVAEAEVEEACPWPDRPSLRGLLIVAAADAGRPFAPALATRGLADRDRWVRLCAARAAEQLEPATVRDAVITALAESDGDPYLQVALLRTACVADPPAFERTLIELCRLPDVPRGYRRELLPRLPGRVVGDWMVLGYFPAPEAGAVAGAPLGPETDADTTRVYAGKEGREVRWTPRAAGGNGVLDLRALTASTTHQENAIAFAQTYLYSPSARDVTVALGTDDGCRVFLRGALAYESTDRRGVDPIEHVARWRLEEGFNRVLFKVENGSGGFGLALRVFDDAVTFTTEPR